MCLRPLPLYCTCRQGWAGGGGGGIATHPDWHDLDADPDLYPANDADPTGSGSTTLSKIITLQISRKKKQRIRKLIFDFSQNFSVSTSCVSRNKNWDRYLNLSINLHCVQDSMIS
jgi:hypothetical protein